MTKDPGRSLTPLTPLAIRAARPGDARRVARLHALSQRVTYGPDLTAGAVDDIDEDSMCQQWHRRLTSCGHRAVLLAETTGAGLAGFGMISRDPPPWSTVNSLHVHPDLHRRGLGRVLLTALVEVAMAWQRPDVQLYVLATNIQAHRFYEHLGWQRRGRAPDHAISGHPVEILRYELRRPVAGVAPVWVSSNTTAFQWVLADRPSQPAAAGRGPARPFAGIGMQAA